MWTKARLTIYIGGAIVGLAMLATVMGFGVYDAETKMFDLHPFNVYYLAGILAGPVSSVVAAVAVAFGWGGKK